MKQLLPYLKPFKKQCIIGPLCKWLEALLELILPTIMAFMINEGVMHHDQDLVIRYGLLMVCMVIIGFAFSITCQYHASLASQGFGTNLRNLLYERILAFSHEDLDRFSHSSLIVRIGSDVDQLQQAVAMLIRLVVRAPFIAIGACAMAMMLDMRLAMILLACVPLIGAVLFLFIKVTTPLYQLYQRKLDSFVALLEQNLMGVRVIRAFVSQRQERAKLNQASSDLQRQMLQVSRISSLLNPLNALILNMAIVCLLYFGIIATPGTIAAGTLIAFINYAAQMLLALVVVSNLIVIFTKAAASAKRINELLAITPTFTEGSNDEVLDQNRAICLHHVSFTYPNAKKPALIDLSFTVQDKETIGIIGGTGSGKSTLAALFMHFYECPGLTLYGRLPSQYCKDALRRLITLVPQHNELFSGTLRDNLYYGNPNASDEQLWQALREAQAQDFVLAKQEGLAMRIEAGGKNLSGGQRQRICIARALLRQSRILILDDSFSALDYQTDQRLRSQLAKHQDMTKLIISQRIATIRHADRILVLDQGRMVGFGKHEELYDTCEVYREICLSQHVTKEVTR